MTVKKTLIAAIAAAAVLPALGMGGVAQAQPDHAWRAEQDQNWDPADHYDHHRGHDRRLSREDAVYRGRDGRYYCKRNDGTTGLVVGGIAGALIGNAAGRGNTLDTLIGAAGGAALGNAIDRGKVKCR